MERKEYNKIKDTFDEERFKKQLIVNCIMAVITMGFMVGLLFLFNKQIKHDFKVQVTIIVIVALVLIMLDRIVSKRNKYIPYSYYNYYSRYRICYFIFYGIGMAYARELNYPFYIFLLLELLYLVEEIVTSYHNYKAFMNDIEEYKSLETSYIGATQNSL